MDISVVIITYNQEEYIEQTLDSILKQDFDGEFEIIIGDDGSKDETRQILKQYSETYPEIVKPIFNEINLGIVRNYYNVISHCTGKYIMVCGGDDYWLPGKMSAQFKVMEENPSIGLCYGNAKKLMDGDESPLSEYVGGKSTTFSELMVENKIPACTTCIRRETLVSYITEVDPVSHDWKMEDYPTWLWMSKNSAIYYMDKNISVYRILRNSASHKFDVDKRLDFYNSLFSVKRFFCEEYTETLMTQEYNTLKSLYYLKGVKSFRTFSENYNLGIVKRDRVLCKIPFFLLIRNQLYLYAVRRMK